MENKTLAIASVVSAVLASLCCIGPLTAVGLGLGAFGASAVFESLRPYLLVATAALLGAAFYLTYRKRTEETCEDGSCVVIPATKLQKRLLWLVTAIVVPLAAFPYYSGVLLGGVGSASAAGRSASVQLTEVVFDVEGMTCAGCAVSLETALNNTSGVDSATVNLEQKSALIRFDPSQVTIERLRTVMDETGFPGTPRADPPTKLGRPAGTGIAH